MKKLVNNDIISALIAFFLLTPYPAINLGNSSSLNIASILGLGFLLLNHRSIKPKKDILPIILILLPMVISLLYTILFRKDAQSLSIKFFVSISITMLAIPLAGIIIRNHAKSFILGILYALIMHASVGLIQLYYFKDNVFPLTFLFINNSFSDLSSRASDYALYIKRPMGLFPEPSALSASVSVPAIIAAYIGFSGNKSYLSIVLLSRLASVGILTIFIFSLSGGGIISFLSISSIILLSYVSNSKKSFKLMKNTAAIILSFVLIYFASLNFYEDRLTPKTWTGTASPVMGSWDLRYDSIIVGISLIDYESIADLLLGVGLGQSTNQIYQYTGYDGIWSIYFKYLAESGLIFSASFMILILILFYHSNKSKNPILCNLCLITFILSILFYTSYDSLLGIWISIPIILNWESLINHDGRKRQVVG